MPAWRSDGQSVYWFQHRAPILISGSWWYGRFMTEIKKLSEREKELRAELHAGQISDDDPRWVSNRGAGKLYAREG